MLTGGFSVKIQFYQANTILTGIFGHCLKPMLIEQNEDCQHMGNFSESSQLD